MEKSLLAIFSPTVDAEMVLFCRAVNPDLIPFEFCLKLKVEPSSLKYTVKLDLCIIRIKN